MSYRAKIERAKKHIDELSAATKAYIESGPMEVFETEEAATGDLVVRVRINTPIPVELWGCIIGDIIHNLRAALDLAVSQLIEDNGGQVTKDTAFPIGRDEAAFDARSKTALVGMADATAATIAALKPYSGGNEDFVQLHALDIADKHRWLLLAGASTTAVVIDMGSLFPMDVGITSGPLIALRPADRGFPLKSGDEVYRVSAAGRATHKDMPRFQFTIMYGEKKKIVWDRELLPHLRGLLATVEKTINSLPL